MLLHSTGKPTKLSLHQEMNSDRFSMGIKYMIAIGIITFIVVMMINWEKDASALKWHQGSRLRRRVFIALLIGLFVRDEWFLPYYYESLCDENDGFIINEWLPDGARVYQGKCSYEYNECLAVLETFPQLSAFEFYRYGPDIGKGRREKIWFSMELSHLDDEACPATGVQVSVSTRKMDTDWIQEVEEIWGRRHINDRCLVIKELATPSYQYEYASIGSWREGFRRSWDGITLWETKYLMKENVIIRKRRSVRASYFYRFANIAHGRNQHGCKTAFSEAVTDEGRELAKEKMLKIFYAKAFGVRVESLDGGDE